MGATTMSKKQPRPTRPAQVTSIVPPPPPPQPKRYTPPHCSMCTEVRPTGKDYTSVYAVRRETEYTIRYCKCAFCGNTFKDTEKN